MTAPTPPSYHHNTTADITNNITLKTPFTTSAPTDQITTRHKI